MLRSRSRTRFALLALVLPLGCARILGFEQASLDPEGNRVLAQLNSDAGDGGGQTTVELGDASATTTSDAAASEADAAVQDGSLPLDCPTFCGVVLDACPRAETESFAVYDSTFTCLRQCEAYAVGSAGDDTGNTLACRMTHALIARDFPGERANSCPAAGPGGNGVCGSNCEGYCNLMLRTCDTFTTDAECQSACREVPDQGGFEVSQNEGNSVQCRLYHLGAALASPTFHCPHASGESPCAETLALPLP